MLQFQSSGGITTPGSSVVVQHRYRKWQAWLSWYCNLENVKSHQLISKILRVLDLPAFYLWFHPERPLGPPESSSGSATSPDAASKPERIASGISFEERQIKFKHQTVCWGQICIFPHSVIPSANLRAKIEKPISKNKENRYIYLISPALFWKAGKKIPGRSPHGDRLDVCDTLPAASRTGTVQPSPEARFAREFPEGNAGLNPSAERVAPAAGSGGVMKIFIIWWPRCGNTIGDIVWV